MTKSNRDRKVFMVGGGIGCMAAAAFLIRDAGVPGGNIAIYEALPLLGGASMAPAIRTTAIRCAAAAC